MREILDHFLIPIETSSEKKEVYTNLYDDLELLKCQDKSSDSSSFYHKLFNPKGNAGKLDCGKIGQILYFRETFFSKIHRNYIRNVIPSQMIFLCVRMRGIYGIKRKRIPIFTKNINILILKKENG